MVLKMIKIKKVNQSLSCSCKRLNTHSGYHRRQLRSLSGSILYSGFHASCSGIVAKIFYGTFSKYKIAEFGRKTQSFNTATQ